MSLQPNIPFTPVQNREQAMNSIFASAGANSSNLSFSTPPMQKSSSNLHGRKRFVDGGSADDGASNGAGGPYRSVAYRTEGLCKFSGDLFLSMSMVAAGGQCCENVS